MPPAANRGSRDHLPAVTRPYASGQRATRDKGDRSDRKTMGNTLRPPRRGRRREWPCLEGGVGPARTPVFTFWTGGWASQRPIETYAHVIGNPIAFLALGVAGPMHRRYSDPVPL